MSNLTGIDPAFAQWLTTWGTPAPVDVPPPEVPVEVAPPLPIDPVPAIQLAPALPAPEQPDPIGPPPLPPGVEVEPSQMQPGLGIPALTVEQSMAPPPMPAPTGPSPFFDATSPQSWQQPLAAPDLVDMGRRDPVAFMQHTSAMNEQRAAVEREQRAAIDAQNTMRAEQEFNDLKEANAKAAALHDEVLNTKIDPNGRRGTVRRIADVVAVMIGGLVQARKGGPNVAMQIIDSEIDRDIEAQKANMLDKRNAIAELRQRGMSDFQAQQAYRVSWYARAMDDLKTEMQNYDPRGTAAARMAQQTLELQGRIQMAGEAARKSAFEDDLKVRKELRADEENARAWIETQDKHNAAQKKLQPGVGAALRTPAYFASLNLAPPPFDMTDKEYDLWQKRKENEKQLAPADPNSPKARKDLADATKAEADAAAAADGYKITSPETGGDLIQPDGKPFVVMDTEERKKLRGTVAAASNIRKLADKMAELKKKYGGAITSLGSDEAMELRSLTSQIDFEVFKNYDLGAPSEGDKALAEGVRGGVDPTSFVKNATRGWQAFAEGAEAKAITHLRAAGYEGKELRFQRAADLPKPKPKLTDELLERAMKTEYTPTTGLATAAANATPAGQQVNSAYETDVKGLAAQAEFGADEQTKRAARAALEQLAQKHPTEAGRALATETFKQLPGAAPVRER
jgi:hypothetical protein